MSQNKIKILIVDDSLISCNLLKHIIEKDPDLTVAGICSNGHDAIQWLASNNADVITMDIVMPKMNGFETTRKIMESKPVPVVIITSAFKTKDAELGFRAIEAGALAILEKPAGPGDALYQQKSQEIIQIIKTIKDVKLIKRNFIHESAKTPRFNKNDPMAFQDFECIAIGTSIGGPAALMNILSQLKHPFPVPIFIVQHIIPGFTEGLADWLQEHSKLDIVLPKDGMKAKPGTCYLAPDNYHMEVRKGNVIALIDAAGDPIKPSASRLFKSIAEIYGKKAIGLILTGMGKDGANELLLMKKKGAYTIAQDEKSCVVFGMPAEAIRLGAACTVLPLDQIPFILNDLIMPKSILQEKIYEK